MKKKFLILPSFALLLFFNSDVFQQFCPTNVLPDFELKRVGNDFAAFHYNAQGKVQEYFLIQGSDWNIAQTSISKAVYNESADIQLTGANGNTYIFSLRSPTSVRGSIYTFSVNGIAHVKSSAGLSLKDMETLAFARVGGSPGTVTRDCDKTCLSGGCGSNQCSRQVQVGGAMECSVSCNSNYFACCGDLISYGCHCIKSDCCGQ